MLLAVLRLLLARLLHRLGRDDRAGSVRRLIDVGLADGDRSIRHACALVSALDLGRFGLIVLSRHVMLVRIRGLDLGLRERSETVFEEPA